MSLVEIDFQFPDWAGVLREKTKELNLFIAAQVQFNRGMLFDQEGAWNGRPRWPDLVFRSGQILSKRGTLRKSIAPFNPKGIPGEDGIVKFSGDVITVGTKLMYARMMNDGTTKMPGGVLKPVRAKALKIPIPQGKNAGEGAKEIQSIAVQKKINRLTDELDLIRDRKRKMASRGRKVNWGVTKSEQKIYERVAKLAEKMGKGEGGGVKFIFRKSVKIPARPFDDWNQADQADLDAALLNKVQDILNKNSSRRA